MCLDLVALLNPAIDVESVGFVTASHAVVVVDDESTDGAATGDQRGGTSGGSKTEEVEVQFKGKGPFVAVTMTLSGGGKLSMQPTAISGGQHRHAASTPRKAHRHANVFGCTVRTPKNKRKGHEHLFRIDLAKADSKDVKKYIVSAPSWASCEAWREVLETAAA